MDPYSQQQSSEHLARHDRNLYQQTNQQPNGSAQHLPLNAGYGYDAHQQPPTVPHLGSLSGTPAGTPHKRTFSSDVDITMEDADPYNSAKYPSRPMHQQRPSGQYLSQHQDTSRRYSPTKALSPQSPYTPSASQSAQGPYGQYHSNTASARQSPTRQTAYGTPSQSYYSTPSE